MWTKLPPPDFKSVDNQLDMCLLVAIQYNDESGTRFVFACQGIEPCQANADAGTRRPQVRLRPPP